MSTPIVAIDPGSKGAVSLLRPGRAPLAWAFKPQMLVEDLAVKIVNALKIAQIECERPPRVFIEEVGSRPTDGRVGLFSFGRSAGHVEMAVVAHGFRPQFVAPQIWQARMNCLSGGNKNVTKRRAIELFGAICRGRITHSVADALLIAAYGRELVALEERRRVAQSESRASTQSPEDPLAS